MKKSGITGAVAGLPKKTAHEAEPVAEEATGRGTELHDLGNREVRATVPGHARVLAERAARREKLWFSQVHHRGLRRSRRRKSH